MKQADSLIMAAALLVGGWAGISFILRVTSR